MSKNKLHVPTELGDFTAGRRTLAISLLAIVTGAVSCAVALGLMKLIAFFTNAFYFQRFDFVSRDPAQHTLGLYALAVPIVGALIIGLMARYGSERIRGHGIPEAIEAILMNGSRVEPKLALLKPLSSAISIGSGGPFGAEGPIIMTGGAFGSLTAQLFKLTSAERKTLLVAGAAAGMSATFGAPLASVLLAFELLLFEWKPRSLVPVALASATAALLRHYWIGPAGLFPTPPHPEFIGAEGLLLCVAAGLLGGCLSAGLTASVYFFEDAFHKLPIHWMWWPAIGGLGIGLGGLVFPEALGVGYGTIGKLLQGDFTLRLVLGVLVVKWGIWAFALGSGTSGGVLAPLLMMGGALGGVESAVFPDYGPGFWPMLSMAATLGGTMRCPFTAIVFALELTQEYHMIFPLMIGAFVAYGFTVLTMKRSILTEKISRRGFHLSREYAVDPLEILFVRDVMRTNVLAFSLETKMADLVDFIHKHEKISQRLFPVLDDGLHLLGVITHKQILDSLRDGFDGNIAEWMNVDPLTATPLEPLRAVANRMAEQRLTRLPVIDPENSGRFVGLVSLRDLLHARAQNVKEEHHRERIFGPQVLSPSKLPAGNFPR
jgi:H+/Cl- antiporter ClcA/CBS domain-containing protein